MAEPVSISPMSAPGVAAVLARKGAVTAVGQALGAQASDRPMAGHKGPYAFVAVGPGSWLVLRAERPSDFLPALRASLGDVAWVADQSGAYHVYRIEGPAARTVLQRGVPIDLHADRFGPGSAACTAIAHIALLLWRADDHATAFTAAVPRSYEASFRRWFDLTVAAL